MGSWPSTAGGGGIGMKVCRDAEELAREFESVVRLSERSFGSGGVFIERFIQRGIAVGGARGSGGVRF